MKTDPEVLRRATEFYDEALSVIQASRINYGSSEVVVERLNKLEEKVNEMKRVFNGGALKDESHYTQESLDRVAESLQPIYEELEMWFS